MYHIRYHENLGFWPKVSPKNQLHNTILAPWQYWLGITKLQGVFSTTLNVTEFSKITLIGAFDTLNV